VPACTSDHDRQTDVPSSGVYAGSTVDERAHFDNAQLVAKYVNQ